ncbi:MAG: family 1 glycosylhydrolase [Blastochloris sp.]|nr:family 1 glycosylhydrolase [Blastochloris sp.]
MSQSSPFFWGVSTSGYQHEGGFNQTGNPLNNWYEWERDGKVETSGRSIDFWNRYEEDFQRCQAMGLNSFRLGIAWSRVQPSICSDSTEEPDFDEEAINHYGKILLCARQHGLEPLITLHHFTTPHWLGPDAWLKPETINLFLKYVTKVVPALNSFLLKAGEKPLRWFITINEPNMLVTATYLMGTFPTHYPFRLGKARQALQHLLTAHVRAYRLLHELYEQNLELGQPMVTFNNYTSDLYWLDQALMDIMLAPEKGVAREDVPDWLYDRCQTYRENFRQADLPFRRGPAYWLGILVKGIQYIVGPLVIRDMGFKELLKVIYESPEGKCMDYIAFDYYDPFAGHSFRWPQWEEWGTPQRSIHAWMVNHLTAKTWDWRMLPQGLHFFVTHYSEAYAGLPLVIAENGMAHLRSHFKEKPWRRDGLTRSDFLRLHIPEVIKLTKEGYPLIGYFYWSLTDNYEWGSYAARFGLYEVDLQHESLERLELTTLGDNPSQTLAELIKG